MSEKEIQVTTIKGEKYVVRFGVPENLSAEDSWNYICNWIDENLKDVVEWE